ncbi:SDR family oxidoreductase [Actinomadura barringtoniae]|uniref:SDR family oxidoreductase n=1 Tax=Actinomadura barringtoniae TaxID=1427535 RepID=A0A939PJE3_9ACTN|nr:oxidoreductase [Actinomadura barringtoniae]MBO2453253.1 SDR family oxidoreductase [Actinomadura barringtoniae]
MGWTADDIPDLSGRRAIVTGANSGLGYHTALQLARHGATVVMACRSAERGQEAYDRVMAAVPKGDVTLAPLDLADLSSVRAFAARQDGPLDVLVNNAGVMAIPRRSTADGFEMQFGTNHLGHFALTGLLLPALLAAGAPRVVTVASAVGYLGRLRFDDLQGERRYNKWSAYAQSKFANLVFAKELDRRVEALTSMASHPGYAATNLQTAGPKMSGRKLEEKGAEVVSAVIGQSAASGALPSLYAATAPVVRGGAVYGPRIAQYRGAPARVFAPPAAGKPELGRRLWKVSEDLTGVTYDLPAN